MSEILALKTEQINDNSENKFEIEFSVETPLEFKNDIDSTHLMIVNKMNSVDQLLEENQKIIDSYNKEIYYLTNHSDGLDYTVAVASGIIAGVIDIVFVGDFSFDQANLDGDKLADKIVVSTAKMKGYKGNDVPGAIRHLEKNFTIAADTKTKQFGGGKQHHLRDFSHHPNLVGLFFSMLTQFTGNVYGTDTAGIFKFEPLSEEERKLFIGEDLPHKILFGVIWWFFHMISDLAGSSGTRADGKMGTGLPGPIVSLLKEASALPIFKKLDKNGNKEFSVWISKLFNGTLLAERDANGKITKAVKCDLRTELGAIKQLGKQAIPVLINECVVRGFYLIRRLITEIKDKKPKSFGDFKELDWRTIAPTKNRTIVRMLTISTGTMTAIDLADAAIESAIESAGAAATGPGVAAAFATHMLLKVNFVGLGRFAIAIGTDVSMGIKKDSYVAKRTAALQKQLNLYQSKVFLKQADVFCSLAETYATAKDLYLKEEEVWTEVVSNEEAINELITRISLVTAYYLKTYDEMISTTYGIAELLPEAEKNNPGLNKILFGGR